MSCSQGDSGGPVMYLNSDGQYELTAVVSFGNQFCEQPGLPGVMAKTSGNNMTKH